MTRRPSLAALAVGTALLVNLTACGSQGGNDVTTVTGNCALKRDVYRLSPLSTDSLEAALGPGAYEAEGSVFSDDRTDSTRAFPLNGQCSYSDNDGVRRLTLGISEKGLPGGSYEGARQTQASDSRAKQIDGADGYVITDDVTETDGSTTQHSVAVVFRDKRVVSADLLVPGKGVDAEAQAVAIVKDAAAAFDRRMPGAS